jgi:transglutaminase-like putative cysteine protease
MTSRLATRIAVAGLAAAMGWTALWSWGGLVEKPGRFLDPALLGALLVVGVGATARHARWRWYAVLPAQIAVLLVWLDHRYAAADAWAGWVPTVSSVKVVAARIRDGADAVNTFASPVSAEHPETYAYLLACSVLVLLAIDVFAFGIGRVPWSGLPVIVTLTVPISVLETSLSWVVFGATALLFMMLLATEETDRVLRWGRSVAGRGERIDSLDQVVNGATVRGAALRIGLVTAAGALVLPILVPVGSGLFDHGNGPGNGKGPSDNVTLGNPIVDLRRDLISQDHIPLVEARTTADPSYLRLTVLDHFNGVEWLPSDRSLPAANDADGDIPAPPGLAPTTPGQEARWTLTLDPGFQTSWLPTPYPTRRISVAKGDWRYDLRTLDVANVDKTSTAGLHYELTGFTPQYSTLRMQQALTAPPGIRDPMTSVPGNRPSVITRIAEEVTAGATSDYDRMVRLQTWFRNTGGFSYSLEPASGSGISQLVRFLTTDKVGYCEQFAAAMAVLARSLGVPARVAVGFLNPEKQADGSYRYTSDDLHSWPEIYFSGSGWVRFEPTPASRTGQPPAWTTGVARRPQTASSAPSAAASRNPDRTPRDSKAPSRSDRSSDSGVTTLAWIVVLALALLILALPRVVRARQRRRRLDDHRRGPGNTDALVLAEGAWAELLATARDHGVSLPVRRSVRDVATVLRRRALPGAPALDQLDELVGFVERARYGLPFPVDPSTRQAVVEAVEAWTAVLAASVPARTARLAQVFPRSVLDRRGPGPVPDRQLELAGSREVR